MRVASGHVADWLRAGKIVDWTQRCGRFRHHFNTGDMMQHPTYGSSAFMKYYRAHQNDFRDLPNGDLLLAANACNQSAACALTVMAASLIGPGAIFPEAAASLGVENVEADTLDYFAVRTAEGATGAARIPFGPGSEKAWNVLERVTSKGSPLPGYKGGSVFKNSEGLLPELDGAGNSIAYREWDVNPYVKGVNRGPERIVTGSDGSAYYTADHYSSFLQFWGFG